MTDSTRTMLRESRYCPEYSEFFPTARFDDPGQWIGDRTQRRTGQVRWFGQDLSGAPDSGIGYTQDNRTQWVNGGWVELDSNRPTSSQPMGRKRQAGDWLDTRPNVDREVRRTKNRWGTPRKRAVFGSDGPDSMSSGSDIAKAQLWWPPDGEYPVVAQSGLSYGKTIFSRRQGLQVWSWRTR